MMRRILVVLSIAVVLIAISTNAATTLPDSLWSQVLNLRAQGKITEADSLEKVLGAQLELSKIQKKAQVDLMALWDRTVRPLNYDECLAWAIDSSISDKEKQDRLNWLSKRWKLNAPDASKSIKDQVSLIKSELEARARLNEQIAASVGKTVPKMVDKVLSDRGLGTETISSLRQQDSHLVGMIGGLQSKMALLEQHAAKQDTINTDLNERLASLQDDFDQLSDELNEHIGAKKKVAHPNW